MEKLKIPAKNKHGLVIPPDISPIEAVHSGASHLRRSFIDRHHLYFPRFVFQGAGELAFTFREHHFNSVWLSRRQHERLHRRYNDAVVRQPDILMPEDDVMATFLDEAYLLDELNVCVKAIEMIDEAIYEGRVKKVNKVQEHRCFRMDRIHEVLGKTQDFQIVTRRIVEQATLGIDAVIATERAA